MAIEGIVKAGSLVSNVTMSFEAALVVGDGNNCTAFGNIVGIISGLVSYGVNPVGCVSAAPGPQVYRAIGVYQNISAAGVCSD